MLAGSDTIPTLHKDSTGVDIFFSLIFSYFCFLVAALSPCQGSEPRLKYISTYPRLSMSSRRLESIKEGRKEQSEHQLKNIKWNEIKHGGCLIILRG